MIVRCMTGILVFDKSNFILLFAEVDKVKVQSPTKVAKDSLQND